MNNMPDLQDKLNQILSNPEALKQVQSLGEQLGLTGKGGQLELTKEETPKNITSSSESSTSPSSASSTSPSALLSALSSTLSPSSSSASQSTTPPVTQSAPPQNNILNGDMIKVLTKVAPLLSSMNSENNTTTLLHALRPFLSNERQQKLDKAEKMLKIIKLMPLLKENGLFM